jgi:catechol 2,3-dioxygenase-like lactoylglutathione lyase family enzyme
MSFLSSIIVVEDIARSRKLYEGILGMKVTADFGIYNVGFEGGLSMYNKAFFQELSGRAPDLSRHHNLVLYFEIDRLEEMERAVAANGFEFIHSIREQPWKQRNFRFYDCDNHVLEVAERMDAVCYRLLNEGNAVEDIARMTGMPEEEIRQAIERQKALE